MHQFCTDAETFEKGMRLYGTRMYTQAADTLAPLAANGDLIGSIGGFFAGKAKWRQGIEALRACDYAVAAEMFRAAYALAGRRCDATVYLARQYAGSQLEALTDAGGLSSTDPASQREIARRLWRQGDRRQARRTIARAVRESGQRAELLVQMGLFDAAEDRTAKAIARFSRAVELAPDNAECHYHLGLAQASVGLPGEAVESFAAAWQLRPDDLLPAMQVALAAGAVAASQEAVTIRPPEPEGLSGGLEARALARQFESDPDLVDSLLSLPVTCADTEVFQAVALALKQALDDHPQYADLQLRLSKVLTRLSRLEEAVDHARTAVETNPQYVQAHLHLGRLYRRLDREIEAADAIDKAIACGADWPDVHCLAGELLTRCGMAGRARRHFRRALELKPDYNRAIEALASQAA